MITPKQIIAVWRNPKVQIISEDKEEIFFKISTSVGKMEAIYKKISPRKIIVRWVYPKEHFTHNEVYEETLNMLGINKIDFHMSKVP